MRRCTFLLLVAGVLCVLFNNHAFAQASSQADTGSQQNARKNARSLYYSSLGKESPLYNGTAYYLYDPIIKGNAYYSDVNAFTRGSVDYDNMHFTNVPMLYDIYADAVVILLYNHFSTVALIKDKVNSFDFLDHHFIRIDTVTFLNNPVIKPGFYDEVYNGQSQVLVKTSKDIQTTSNIQTLENYFELSKSFFIRKNNIYYTFSSQGSLLDILKDKKKELQKYIKQNHIRYRSNPEDAMVKIASYYDQLTK